MDKGDSIMRSTIRQRPRDTKPTCILFYTGLEIMYLNLSAMSGPMLRLDKLYDLSAILFSYIQGWVQVLQPLCCNGSLAKCSDTISLLDFVLC